MKEATEPTKKKKPSVVVVTTNRRVQRHVTRALASAGCDVHVADFTHDDVGPLLADYHNLWVIDAEHSTDAVRWVFHELYSTHKKTNVLLLSHEAEETHKLNVWDQVELIVDQFADEGVNHLVARHGGVSSARELVDEAELMVTARKLFGRDIFGLEKYVSTWGSEINEATLSSLAEKEELVSELEEWLGYIDCSGAIVPAISMVADELLMNAMFNAPRDAEGNAKYVDRPRGEPLDLEPNEKVTLNYGCDGRYVGISVTDNFGSLEREMVVKYLERCFFSGMGEIENKPAGAGLGLYMVFNSITQLIFNIEQGKRTEVIALFYVRSGVRAFKTSGRSLNIFCS